MLNYSSGDPSAVSHPWSDGEPAPAVTSSKAPTSYDVTARRGVPSTKTPIGSGAPQRAQTLPVSTTETDSGYAHNVRHPVHTSTMPTPAPMRRSTSGSRPNTNSMPLGLDEDYIVEPLPTPAFPLPAKPDSSFSEQQGMPEPQHAHPHMPVPYGDPRQSMATSIQTEPSSYYSAEDHWPSVPPPLPTLPEPGFTHQDQDLNNPDPYGDYPPWLVRPSPPMPIPRHETSPPMPTSMTNSTAPYEQDPNPANNEDTTGHPFANMPDYIVHPAVEADSPEARPLHSLSPLPPTPPGRPSRRYNGAAAIIPPPPTTPPPSRPNTTFVSMHTNEPRPQTPESSAKPSPQIAPLRVEHHQRPPVQHHNPPQHTTISSSGRPATGQNQPNIMKPDNQSNQAVGTVKPPVSQYTSSTSSTTGRLENRTSIPSNTPRPAHSTNTGNSAVRPEFTSQKPPVQPSQKPNSSYSQSNLHHVETQRPPTASFAPTKQEATASSSPHLATHQPARPTATTSLANSPQRINATASSGSNTSYRPPVTQTHSTATASRPDPIPSSTTQRPTISSPQQQQPITASSSKPQSKPQSKPTAKPEKPAKQKPSEAIETVPSRPHFKDRPSQMDTQYVNMLLALDDIPLIHNLSAGFFNWILLAGFILFPGTFASLQSLTASTNSSQIAAEIVNSVTKLPLYIVAWVCCGIGAAGMLWLWWRWRKNYLWSLNKIFLPGLLNSLAGLLSTLVNIFGVQNGQLSTTSKSTLGVTVISTGVFGILVLFYTFWLVRRVKSKHDKEVGRQTAGKHGEGLVDLTKARARA